MTTFQLTLMICDAVVDKIGLEAFSNKVIMVAFTNE